jgi:hypothetical protein
MDTRNSQGEHAKGHLSNMNRFNSGIFKISTVPFSKIERQLSTTLGHKLTKALINGIQLNFKQQIKDF